MASKPKPTVSISLCEDRDIAHCFRVMGKSFGNGNEAASPFVNMYFPRHDSAAGQVSGIRTLLAWKKSDKDTHFLKATIEDPDGDRKPVIAGFAMEEVWPDPSDRQFMNEMWKSYIAPRSKALEMEGEKGIYVLELLAVHPSYQRLGAGKSLVSWGTRKADEINVKSVVESTMAGRKLYEKCGFRSEIEEMRFDVSERFVKEGRRVPRLVFMGREPLMMW